MILAEAVDDADLNEVSLRRVFGEGQTSKFLELALLLAGVVNSRNHRKGCTMSRRVGSDRSISSPLTAKAASRAANPDPRIYLEEPS